MASRATALSSLIVCLGLLGGCAHVISPELRERAIRAPIRSPGGGLLDAPEQFRGKTVVLAGVIVRTENLPEGTMIEVMETPADSRGRPMNLDASEGRIFVLREGVVLDPLVFAPGREVTFGGEVLGGRKARLGEISRVYPVIAARELYLWEPRQYRDPYWDRYDDDRRYGGGLGGWWGGRSRFGVGVGVGRGW